MATELTLERHALKEDGKPTPTKFGESTGDRYRVKVIEGGSGSSGFYPIDMLERDAPAAFPEGTRMRANHDGLCEAGGDIRRVIARTISTPVREGNAIFADILVSEQWSEYVREFGDIIGLSISAYGEYEDRPDGSESSDRPGYYYDEEGVEHQDVVARLASAEESPYNSIDFVEAPGAGGRIVAALESARSHLPDLNVREAAAFAGAPGDRIIAEHRTSGQPGGTEEDIEMDEQTLRQILAEAQSNTLESVKATIAEASKPAETPAEKPTLERTAEAVVGAGLTEHGRKAVYAAIERGEALDDAITAQKAYEDGVRESVKAELAKTEESGIQHGFVTEAGGANESFGEFNTAEDVLKAMEGAR